MKTKYHIETNVIHAGQSDHAYDAVVPPIVTSSTFKQQSPGVYREYEYSRAANPTRSALESNLAALELGSHGFAFASGLAAIDAILQLLQPGDHIIASNDLYGGTYRLFQQIKQRNQGLRFTFIDAHTPANIAAAITEQTAMLWVETPSNPRLNLIDLQQAAELCQQHNIIRVCDNTFASPILQQPLKLGFDLVVHSATKYLNGHSDCILGAIVCDNDALAEQLRLIQMGVGAIAGPFDSYLALRGLKTLALRMARHCENALELASWLQAQPQVTAIHYPGLSSHPQHALAKQQMSAFGGMISVELNADLLTTQRVLTQTRLFTLAESLGGVESLISHPSSMTHATLSADQRAQLRIQDNLIRLSVGIEHIDDLKADLHTALQQC